MPPGTGDFPPQCAESCVTGAIGQINDLAGPEQSFDLEGSTSSISQDIVASPAGHWPDHTRPVPVVITGTRPPSANRFPGLRESMLGSAIIQLAEQIPDGDKEISRIREEIIAAAVKLHRAGANKILANSISRTHRVRDRSKQDDPKNT